MANTDKTNTDLVGTLKNTYNSLCYNVQSLYDSRLKQAFADNNIDITNLSQEEIKQKYQELLTTYPEQFESNIYISTESNIKQYIQNINSEKEAIKEQLDQLSKEPIQISIQAKKEELETAINKVSQIIIDKELNNILDKHVKDIMQKYNNNLKLNECIEAVQNGIRAFKYATYQNENSIEDNKEKVKQELIKILNDATDKNLTQLTNQGVQLIRPIFTDTQNQLHNVESYLSDIDKLEIKADMIYDLEKKFTGNLSSIDNTLKKYGIESDISGQVNTQLRTISKDIANDINEYLKPATEYQTKIISSVSTTIKRYETIIEEYQQSVQKLITRWENTAKDYIKQQEEKIISKIASSIKIKI